jgi:hypothetical protein
MVRPRPLRPAVFLVACALAVALSACGSSAGRAPQHPVPTGPVGTTSTPSTGGATTARNDKRGAALGCIHGKGIAAEPVGAKSIQVEGPKGPRINFFQSSLEAEGDQFEGNGEGAEQIGAALLYGRGASEGLLNDLELCLNKQ